jgi:hypothetical protein
MNIGLGASVAVTQLEAVHLQQTKIDDAIESLFDHLGEFCALLTGPMSPDNPAHCISLGSLG